MYSWVVWTRRCRDAASVLCFAMIRFSLSFFAFAMECYSCYTLPQVPHFLVNLITAFCCAMLFYSMLLYTTLLAWNLWIGMLCYTVLCNAVMLYHTIDFPLCGAMLCHATRHHWFSSSCSLLWDAVLWYVMLCYATLHHDVGSPLGGNLCFAMLWCAMLGYACYITP